MHVVYAAVVELQVKSAQEYDREDTRSDLELDISIRQIEARVAQGRFHGQCRRGRRRRQGNAIVARKRLDGGRSSNACHERERGRGIEGK